MFFDNLTAQLNDKLSSGYKIEEIFKKFVLYSHEIKSNCKYLLENGEKIQTPQFESVTRTLFQ